MSAAAPASVKFTMQEQVLYPEGKHVLQIVDYAPAIGQFGAQIKWTLELIEFEREDGEPARISYFTGMAISAKTKLGKMLQACRIPLPQDPEEAAALDVNDLIGKQFYATLIHKMGKDSVVYTNVAEDSLLPLPKAKAKANELSMPEPVAEKSNAAAANTRDEEIKSRAVAELVPVLRVMEAALLERNEKLTGTNTGPGLKALEKARKAQGADSLANIDFALISLTQIGQAKAEALALAGAGGDDEDPFVNQ